SSTAKRSKHRQHMTLLSGHSGPRCCWPQQARQGTTISSECSATVGDDPSRRSPIEALRAGGTFTMAVVEVLASHRLHLGGPEAHHLGSHSGGVRVGGVHHAI